MSSSVTMLFVWKMGLRTPPPRTPMWLEDFQGIWGSGQGFGVGRGVSLVPQSYAHGPIWTHNLIHYYDWTLFDKLIDDYITPCNFIVTLTYSCIRLHSWEYTVVLSTCCDHASEPNLWQAFTCYGMKVKLLYRYHSSSNSKSVNP
jgi:hypothetical protein